MKRKFLTNLILIFFLNLIVKTFWVFGIDRSVQLTVGTEEYGLYFSLLNLSILLNIILDAGITNFNNRSIAQQNELIGENFSRIVPLKLILAVIYALVVITTGLLAGYSPRQFHILWILIFNQFLLSFILYLRSNISGLHLFRTDSFLSVLDRIFVIIICSILLWSNLIKTEFRIEWFVYAQTISYLLSGIIILSIVLVKAGSVRFTFKRKYAYQLIRQIYPFAILIFLMAFFNRIDSVLLERLLPDGKIQAGIYAQSFRILDAANMYPVLLAGMLLPIFSKMIKNKEQMGDMIKLSFTMIIIPALGLTAISVMYNHEIINLLYYEYTDKSAVVFSILLNCFLFNSFSYIFGTLLTANGSLKQLNLMALLTVFINLTLNIILIPRLKVNGAAIAALCSQFFFAIAQILTAVKCLNLKTDFQFLLKLTGLFSGVLICSALVHFFVSNWITGVFTIIIFILLLSWILKILTPKYLYKIIKLNE